MNRRSFLKMAAVGSAAALNVASGQAKGEGALSRSGKLIDGNVTLFQWPGRRLPWDEPKVLAQKLKQRGVSRAWASSFEGLLHKDIGSVNRRLKEACAAAPIFVPLGVINPMLSGWETDLRRCAAEFRMPGIRLFPGYHGYTLANEVFATLMKTAGELRMLVQICLTMEDERLQHSWLRAKPVDAAPLVPLLARNPGCKVVLLNWAKSTRMTLASNLARTGQVWFDMAMLEGVGGIETLLASVPANRVLFGSHSPFYYFEAAALKLQESAIGKSDLEAIARGNAQTLMG